MERAVRPRRGELEPYDEGHDYMVALKKYAQEKYKNGRGCPPYEFHPRRCCHERNCWDCWAYAVFKMDRESR